MIRPRSSAPSGDLPAALREWCQWIYLHADLAQRAAPKARTPEGELTTWLDHCGMYERRLIEAAMRAGIFEPVGESSERQALAAQRRADARSLGRPVP